ncbi:hypothetical protein Pla52n_44360 [Stieleria varia]|uniref:Uncharacterized protein n=1 Tax=Stieleria varia TaxID=2528005 RepID=A0A5C6AM24_9BACT|nr:hypothetical protein Pla52n_44360 [Stieleria varia]
MHRATLFRVSDCVSSISCKPVFSPWTESPPLHAGACKKAFSQLAAETGLPPFVRSNDVVRRLPGINDPHLPQPLIL